MNDPKMIDSPPADDRTDDDQDGLDVHECEDGEPCPGCTACYQACGRSVCQFTCEHWGDLL